MKLILAAICIILLGLTACGADPLVSRSQDETPAEQEEFIPKSTTTTLDPEEPTTEYETIDMGQWNDLVHTKCDHGNRLYQTEAHEWEDTPGFAVVANDPTCLEQPQ
jgi:hypothetical protein